jgi:hypothetical protein
MTMGSPNPASRPASAPNRDADYAAAYYLTRWGAIAYSPATRRHGYAFRWDDQASAEARARAECGAPDTIIVASASGNYTLTLATAPDGSWGSAINANPTYAQREALTNCPGAGPHIQLVLHPINGLQFEDRGSAAH